MPHLGYLTPAIQKRIRRVPNSSRKRHYRSRRVPSSSRKRQYRSGRGRQPSWSKIHSDIMKSVQEKLFLADILQCRAVCSPWRNLTLTNISSSLNKLSSSPPPPLIIWKNPFKLEYWFLDVTSPGGEEGSATLYNLNDSDDIVNEIGRCLGFSHEWFIFLDLKRNNNKLYLFHPLLFPKAVVCFPPIATPKGIRYRGFLKFVLTAEPIAAGSRGDNWGLVVLHESSSSREWNTTLLFANYGATEFSQLIDCDPTETWDDIICFKNCIYGVARRRLVAWDCRDGNPTKVFDSSPECGIEANTNTTLHLVESQGELLLVLIHRPDRARMTRLSFKHGLKTRELYEHARCPNICRVFKMDFSKKEWVQMDSLGDRVLFIMENQNTCVSSIEFPQYRRNTVYFRHYMEFLIQYTNDECVVGVFNLEDGSMEEIYTNELPEETRLWTR